jgi:hypothetical protein
MRAVTKEEVKENVKKFLGSEWDGSIPFILTELFLKFAEDGSLKTHDLDCCIPNSILETYVGMTNDMPFSLVVYKDVAFINILKEKTDKPSPYSVSIEKIALTRANL